MNLERFVFLDILDETSLEQALLDLDPKVGLQLVSPTSVIEGRKAPRLKGTFPLGTALKKLLEGSGLSYKTTGNMLYVFPMPSNGARKQTEPPSSDNKIRPPESAEGEMAEVRITTGSHIRDRPTPPGAFTVERPDFDGANFQDLGQALRSLPQNFGDGLNPQVISAGGQNTATLSGASSVNLHGMGGPSTLVLLEGQRLAFAEGSASVDVTSIPLAAVERVDIVTGGASAVYGSDAVAGATNIILRDEYQGWEVRSAFGLATDGGGFLQHYSTVGGQAWSTGHALEVFDCAWQQRIDSSQRSFLPLTIAGTSLLPQTQYCSTLVSTRQQVPGGPTVSFLGLYTTRASTATENLDIVQPGVATSSRSAVTQYRVAPTVRQSLGGGWSAALTASVAADNEKSPEALMRNGAPYFNEDNRYDNSLRSTEMSADGTLWKLKTGALKLALGAGYNEENFGFSNSTNSPPSIGARRRTRYLFSETNIPLLASPDLRDEDGPRWSSLSLSVAGRTSWYSDVGSTTNPKIGLIYRSAHNYTIGASWGTSYRAPTLVQQYNTSQVSLKFVSDPDAPNGNSLALFEFGGNPHLRPEVSSDVTLDFTFKPQALEDALFRITLYDIDDTKRIEYPTLNTVDPLSDPHIAPFVLRNPSLAMIRRTLAQSRFLDRTGGAYSPTQATLLIDDRSQNISRQHAFGIDLLATYARDLPIGRLKGSLNVAYLNLRQQVTPESPDLPLSATVFNPPTWRSRVGLNWSGGRLLTSVFFNYTGLSRNTETSTPQPVGSWNTFDATFGYNLPGNEKRPSARFTLSATNILDKHPPYVSASQPGALPVNFDSTNTSAVGTFVTLQVTIDP